MNMKTDHKISIPMIYYRLSILIISLSFVTACATSSSYSTLEQPASPRVEEPALLIPAGVDSAVAADAEKLANESFVSFEEEERAAAARQQAEAYRAQSDTLWYYLALTPSADHEITEEQENEAIRTFNRGAQFFLEMRDLNQSPPPGMTQAEMDRRHRELTDQSILAFEESIRLNPFDNQTRRLLAELYGIKAIRLQEEENHRKAVDVLEKLSRVEQGEPYIFELLAINYEALGNYRQAAENYRKARETLESLAEMTDHYFEHGTHLEEDLQAMHLYAYYEGDAYINLLRPREALAALNVAMQLAPTEEDSAIVQTDIDFINWDNGNIAGSFSRDSLAALASAEQYVQAESGYLALMPNLRTQSARDHIDWRLAIVQYEMGKEEEAAERLMKLVERSEKNPDGRPVDPDYQRYFDAYSTVTFNLGQRKLSERDRRTAHIYFRQTATIPGQNQARANLLIADIVRNNLPEAIRHAQLAEQDIELLNESDRKSLYALLTDLHRRNGDMDQARHYLQLSREL